jgi:NADPH:quinone reductase-like Zn-dependent oxidoreductase
MRVVVDRSFPLNEAPEAHRYMETKRARGKVVLAVD